MNQDKIKEYISEELKIRYKKYLEETHSSYTSSSKSTEEMKCFWDGLEFGLSHLELLDDEEIKTEYNKRFLS